MEISREPAGEAEAAGRAKLGRYVAVGLGLGLLGIAGCSPTVRVEAPEEPIEINLNVRIEQEVRIRIDRELEELFDENDDIF